MLTHADKLDVISRIKYNYFSKLRQKRLFLDLPTDSRGPAWHRDEAYQRLADVKHGLSRLALSCFH